MNQGPARPAVAVGEGVDGLELRVHHGGLHQRGQTLVIDGRAQIVEQAGHVGVQTEVELAELCRDEWCRCS